MLSGNVTADLEDLRPEDEDHRYFRLAIPHRHTNAWLSGLNVARLALADTHAQGDQTMAHRLAEAGAGVLCGESAAAMPYVQAQLAFVRGAVQGENDVLVVRKLEANPNAFGVFGYSFLDQNADKVQGNRIESVDPTFENIADGAYPVSRPLYFYVKKAHVGVIPGIKEYLAEWTIEATFGEEGYLIDKGAVTEKDIEVVRRWAQGIAKKGAPTYAWHLGYGGIPLTEYYLRTGDEVFFWAEGLGCQVHPVVELPGPS